MDKPAKLNVAISIYGFMAIPVVIYLCVFKIYAINMPFFDDYDAVLGWMNQYLSSDTSRGRFFLLFQQHNEHRIVFVYVVELLCFHLFHQINFVFLSFVGSLGLFGIVAAVLYLGKKAGLSNFELIPVPILLLTLSHNQLITLAMAGLQQYWQLLFDILSLIFLTRSQKVANFAAAFLSAVAATFSGGGGLLVFPVGFIYLIFSKRWLSAIIWFVSAAVVFYVYFVDLNYQFSQSTGISHAYAYALPVKFLKFTVQFIGNFGHSTTSALIFGAISIFLYGALFALKSRQKEPAFLYISMFIFVSAIVVGLNRTVLGPQESIASRYTIYGLLNLTMIYLMIVSIIQLNSIRRISGFAGIVISIVIYLSWLNPALATLGYWHTQEKSRLIWSSADAAAAELQAAMREGVFYPKVLYRHTPRQIESNAEYSKAWNELFWIYLVRPDLQKAFPLNGGASYIPLLEWAATTTPSTDQAALQLKPFQPAYKSMLRLLEN
jgi:hypothetical protein